MGNEMAVLMAAGLGTRMRPLTERVPKPLVKVRDVALIETIIRGLQRRGVERIIAVIGYMAPMFEELVGRYPQLELVVNHDFMHANNISSVRAVADRLGGADCFICEADLYVSDPAIFDARLERSCYFAKEAAGWSDDWVFDVDRSGRITHVKLGGRDAPNMVGIAFLKAEDASRLADFVTRAYAEEGGEALFWDEVVDRHLDELDMRVHRVEACQLREVDTIAELAELDPEWRESNEFGREVFK